MEKKLMPFNEGLQKKKIKILGTANSHSLAHVSRVFEILKILKTFNYECFFAGYGKYNDLPAQLNIPVYEIPYVLEKKVALMLQNNLSIQDLFPYEEVKDYVLKDCEFLNRLRPDFILNDNRLSINIAALIMDIPCINIKNIQMSNYRMYPYFKNEIINLILPKKLLISIENVMYNYFVMKGFNKVRKEYKLKKAKGYNHEEGALTLIADHPLINPSMKKLPKSYHYVGPITWKSNLEIPLNLPLESSKKLIYFSIGSLGHLELLKTFALKVYEQCNLVVALGKETKNSQLSLPDNVIIVDFVDADQLLVHCHALICHGGNGSLYQAIRHGVPIIIVSNHLEQYYGGWIMEKLGVGLAFLRTDIEKKGIDLLITGLFKILTLEKYKCKSLELSKLLNTSDGALEASLIIEKFIRSKESSFK
jgi:UDP:flavonoid glycosyltransferase YjiC (YdhE family)